MSVRYRSYFPAFEFHKNDTFFKFGPNKNGNPLFKRIPTFFRLFVLDGRRRLRREVVKHSVYALHLVCDPIHKLLHEFKRYLFDLRCHSVLRVDSPDDDSPLKYPLAIPDAGRAHVGNHRKVLPDLPFKAILCKFLAEDSI